MQTLATSCLTWFDFPQQRRAGGIELLLRPSRVDFHHPSLESLEKRKEKELAEHRRESGCEVVVVVGGGVWGGLTGAAAGQVRGHSEFTHGETIRPHLSGGF